MSKPSIAALVTVRKQSQRCRNKMLRPFAGTTLTDIALQRLSDLRGVAAKYFAAHDQEFVEKAKGHDVTVLARNYDSVKVAEGPIINKVFHFLENVPEDMIIWINSSNAFLSPSTVDRAIQTFYEQSCQSMTSVVKNYNWFYTLDGQPINNLDPMNVSTKTTPPIYEVIHAFHIFNRKHLLEHSAYWRNLPKDPWLFEIPADENVDIDTEEQFEVAEKVYEVRRGAKGAEGSRKA